MIAYLVAWCEWWWWVHEQAFTDHDSTFYADLVGDATTPEAA